MSVVQSDRVDIDMVALDEEPQDVVVLAKAHGR
jgi:hypothetical protein